MSDLPSGWARASIGSICDRLVDGSHNPPKLSDAGHPMLSARNINKREVNFAQARTVSDADFAVEHARTKVAPGDVLLTIVGTIGRTAVVQPNLPSFALQRSVAVLKPRCTDSRYLSLCLESSEIQERLNDLSSGTAQKGIYLKTLATVEIPLAPMAEQERIADKLDTLLARVDACRGRLDGVRPLLQRYRQSVLDAAVSGRLSEPWRMTGVRGDARRALDDLAELLSPGDYKQEFNSAYRFKSLGALGAVGGGLTKNSSRINHPRQRSFLRVANVHANELRLGDVDEIGVTDSEFERTQLLRGDLLIVEGNGSLEQIGRAAIWGGEIESCTHQNHLIRWRAGKQVDPRFALYCLMSPPGRQQIEAVASSTTGLHTLSLSKVAALQIPVPTLEEQKEIVRRVDLLLHLANRLAGRLAGVSDAVDRLTPAVLAKAFRGELVAQDSSDEPAATMLARLAASKPPQKNGKRVKGAA